MYSNPYRIAVLLSTGSFLFGILREILLISFIGFSSINDQLQLYLSIFYTIGLSIDAMRLSCLNLYKILTLSQILFCASILTLPFTIVMSFIMQLSTGGMDPLLLCITMVSSYLNLMVAIVITYKQRNHSFLLAQCINVMPNFILIPGLLFSYFVFKNQFVHAMVFLTSLIPLIQGFLLFLLPNTPQKIEEKQNLFKSIGVFARHFTALIGEQLFQVIIRSAFYDYGKGYLALFSFVVRIYSAGRFILVDSFIGSRLSNWKKDKNNYLSLFIQSTLFSATLAVVALMMSLFSLKNFIYTAIQMLLLFMMGFYFSMLTRIIYFKINRYENNSKIVLRFAFYELMTACIAFIVTRAWHYPLLSLIWIGYIAKPFLQLLLLKKKYQEFEFDME